MSQNDVAYFTNEYSTVLQALLQQSVSAIAPYVMVETHVGQGARAVSQYGKIEARAPTGRNAPIIPQDTTADGRWVYPSDREAADLVNNFDLLRTTINPTNEKMINIARAMQRAKDDIIIPAFFADAKTGVDGTTTTSFPAANQVSVNTGGTASGMNVDKLLKGKQLLMSYFVDPSEQIYCAVTSLQIQDLLKQAQVTSGDFNSLKPLVDGNITRFLGINFVPSERLATDSSSYRRCPMWVKTGMHLGIWGDISNDISQRKDLSSQPWQLYSRMTIGATRVEENRVIEIKCSEA